MNAFAETGAIGSVVEHLGESGELIVSRDGIVYFLTTGDDLFDDDIVRAQHADASTIRVYGCTFTLPEKKDVSLGEEFCSLAAIEPTSMAEIASKSGTGLESVAATNAPLIVGGVVLSAGGIAAATEEGSRSRTSSSNAAAGTPQASASSS